MSERLEILTKIELGEITPEEGARLIQELDLKSDSASTNDPLDQMQILEKIERGELNTEEALGLLQKKAGSAGGEGVTIDFESNVPPNISEEELNKWKRWWMYPLYAGIAFIVLASYWMFSAYQTAGYNFWFFCSWVPLLVGVGIAALSWQSRDGTWLHVRVNSNTERVAISMPLPMGLASWGLRNFGRHIPEMKNVSLDEIVAALDSTAKSGQPFYVRVQDDEDDEQVDVFIG